ncbi:glutaminase [Corynebacterium sp. BCW_4722]|nr:glutaminase [Corynebacterium sp. BCW_4722]
MLSPVTEYLQTILDTVRDKDGGEVADYIDVLKNADPDKLGLALCTADGHLYSVGDDEYEFSIQSISKPFVYALALDVYGPEKVHQHVGVEPSGEAFNALSLDERGRPANPLINAGAITVSQLIGGPDLPPKQRAEEIRKYLSRLAGRELSFDDEVYGSEIETGDRNQAFAHMLREVGTVTDGAHDAVEAYTAQCAVKVTVKDLAQMAATLANAGVQPVTGEKVVSPMAARVAQAVMVSAGMYDASGRWMVEVGIPAKSGVAGGLIGTLPGQLGIASLSPRLDKQGNSVRGVKIFEELSSGLGLNLMSSNFYVAPGVKSIERKEDADIVELQGMINFTAAEKILRELQQRRVDGPNLILDVSGVTAFNKPGRDLIKEGLMNYRDEGVNVSIYDPEHALSDWVFSDGTTAQAIRDFTASFSVDATREEVFEAITRPDSWLGDAVEGEAREQGGEFHYETDDQYVELSVEESDDGKRVVWHVEPGDKDKRLKEDPEWEDTSLIFDIEEGEEGETQVSFTHRGMRPHDRGYNETAKNWRERLAEDLQPLIRRGKENK